MHCKGFTHKPRAVTMKTAGPLKIISWEIKYNYLMGGFQIECKMKVDQVEGSQHTVCSRLGPHHGNTIILESNDNFIDYHDP